ncbi:MAG: TolC family protein [Burkholderiales bacterium]
MIGTIALVVLALTGCAREVYRPKPLDPEASAATLGGRSLASERLRDYLAKQGQRVDVWPRTTWDLSSLTLAAVLFHPDIDVARARARLAAAERSTSRAPLPFVVTVRPEINTKESGGDTPWGLGLLAGLPLDLGNKRAARTEQLARLEDAAVLEIAVASWRVRSRLRRHFVDLHVAESTQRALEAEQRERAALLQLMEARLARGYAAAMDVSALRVRVAEGELAVRRATVRRDQALAGVAEATGIPLAQMHAARFDFAAVAGATPPPSEPDIQRSALLNRIDLRRKLADYAAAEAAVKLEVARQYPELTIIPGYFWDADESIWSIAFSALVPPVARTRALIREAEARREVEEKAFIAVQSSIMAEAQAAASRYRHAFEAHEAARRQIIEAQARRQQVQRQFERGMADRVELVQAQLDAATTERTAIVAMLELQQGLSALEDALQRPLDNPDLMTNIPSATAPADAGLNPALIDND